MNNSSNPRERRLPAPSCGHAECQYHRFPPRVANQMMRRMFSRIIFAAYDPHEWLGVADGMG